MQDNFTINYKTYCTSNQAVACSGPLGDYKLNSKWKNTKCYGILNAKKLNLRCPQGLKEIKGISQGDKNTEKYPYDSKWSLDDETITVPIKNIQPPL